MNTYSEGPHFDCVTPNVSVYPLNPVWFPTPPGGDRLWRKHSEWQCRQRDYETYHTLLPFILVIREHILYCSNTISNTVLEQKSRNENKNQITGAINVRMQSPSRWERFPFTQTWYQQRRPGVLSRKSILTKNRGAIRIGPMKNQSSSLEACAGFKSYCIRIFFALA